MVDFVRRDIKEERISAMEEVATHLTQALIEAETAPAIRCVCDKCGAVSWVPSVFLKQGYTNYCGAPFNGEICAGILKEQTL